MDFKQRKLPKEAVERLRICPIRTVRPYALMMAPVYVYMKLNEKFVMVKGALDFFTEEELERLNPLGSVFFPEEVDISLRFREVANEVKDLLSWNPETAALQVLKERTQGKKEELPLAPSSFELSDAVIRVIGPLWNPGPHIDPFYVSVFANELCDLLPADLLKRYRDQSVVDLERAVMASSWAVFVALHLGYTNLGFLNRLRQSVVQEMMTGQTGAWKSSEVSQLVKAARESLGLEFQSGPGNLVHYDVLKSRFGVTSEKLSSRMRRVERLAHV